MKKKILALMIAAVLLLSGCSLIKMDETVLDNKVVITVGDTTFTRAQVANQLDYQLYYMQQMYSMFGYSYDPTDATTRKTALDGVVNGIIENEVLKQKAQETGMFDFTEDELAEIQTAAESDYQSYIDQTVSGYTDETMTDEEKTAKAKEYIEDNGITMDLLVENQKETKALEKLKTSTVAYVTVTEEEVQADFDEKVASAQSTYATTPSSYGYAMNNGTTVYYAPAGYRVVKQILISYTDDDLAIINDLNTKISATTDETELASLNEQLTAAEETATANIADKVKEVTDKIEAGEDFDALVATYNADTGMPAAGYYICDGYTYFVTSFTNAAMSLNAVGDVSKPVSSNYGVHIIKYVSDVAEGAVDISTVHDSLYNTALTTAQDSAYTTQTAEWVAAANAKIETKYMPE